MHGEVEERKSVFYWKLKKFSSLDNTQVYSPEFRFCGRLWNLSFYPNLSERYAIIYLFFEYSEPPIKLRYSLGIRTAKGVTEVCDTDTKILGRSNFVFFEVARSELLRRRKEVLPKDVLTITLTLQVEDGPSETVLKKNDASVQTTLKRNVADVFVQTAVEESVACGGNVESLEKTGVDKIAEDVGKLWLNSDHADVLLKVRDVEFRAHRTILAARTPVLGAMFQHDTTEKASGEVSIDDCEPEVFEQLLHYIYKGAPSELTAENASALYIVADMYLVSEVKALCVHCMQDTLCLDTFCDFLTLSLMHREDELLKTATEFFSRNMVNVLKTVKWQRFLAEHPTWANEIMIRATQLTVARYEKEK